jgi:hypothetical protein
MSERIPTPDEAASYAFPHFAKLDYPTFKSLAFDKCGLFRQHFENFIDEIKFILNFFKHMEDQIADIEAKAIRFNDQVQKQASQCSVIQMKIAIQGPNKMSAAFAALCAFSGAQLATQINE